MTKSDVNVVALRRDGEHWIVIYDEDHETQALGTLGRWAADDRLSFDWYDAAVMSHKMTRLKSVTTRKPK